MTVIGIMTNPADDLAKAPDMRFDELLSLGSEDEEPSVLRFAASTDSVDMSIFDPARRCRRAFKVEKYKAEPIPVRITDGNVPRHSLFKERGPATISRQVVNRDVERDC